MASVYRPRYPTGKLSPYLNGCCYTCKKAGRPDRWRLLYPDGRRVKSRRDARTLIATHTASCRPTTSQTGRTVGSVLQEYLAATQARRSARAQRDDEHKARRLTSAIGELPITALTTPRVDDVLDRLLRDYPMMGLPRRDKFLVFLRSVCRWAWHRRAYLTTDPTMGVDKLAKPGSRPHLPKEKWSAFLTLCRRSKYYPGILTILYTGIRAAEAGRLEVRDIDLNRALLRIRAEVSKTSAERWIALADVVVATLQRALPREGRAFPYYWPRVQRQVKTYLESAAVGMKGQRPLGLYTLRHAFGTEAVKHFSAFEVQAMMGHRTIQTTQRYIHASQVPVEPARMNQLVAHTFSHTKNGAASRNRPKTEKL